MKLSYTKQRKKTLLIEFILLCAVLPSIIIVFKLAPFMFLFLWGACFYCAWVYYRNFFDGWDKLWRWEEVTWDAMKPILIRWVICTIGMVAFIYWYDPDRAFFLVLERPQFVLVLFMLYPIFSALPQEFIFCSFIFKRYAPFFPKDKHMVIASTIVFAYAHVLFINPVAPFLSLIAGYIFATTFTKSRSLALVTIEHGLYGNALFAIGLGWYFYGGAVY